MSSQEENSKVLRPLGLHERFCTARHNIGAPPVLCYAAKVERSSSGVLAHCSRRIAAILAAYPILSCAVVDAQSRVPRFAMRTVRVEDVLQPIVKVSEPRPLEKYVAEQVQPAPCVFDDLTRAPLWKVKVYGSQGDSIVTLIIHHAINDGRGSANLFQHLLGKGDIPPATSKAIAPSSDSVLPLRPSVSYMLPVVFRELLLPRLPSFIQSYFTTEPSWPSSKLTVQQSPLLVQKGLKRITLRNSLPSLKRIGAKHGVKTINSIVYTAALVTSYVVGSEGDTRAQVKIDSSTAISERAAVNGLPDVGGNFVSGLNWSKTISATDSFWSLAREYATYVTTPSSRTKARMNMGMLSYIPDGPYVSVDITTDSPPSISSWETFLHTKSTSPNPFGAAFEISNLGLISFPPSARVQDVMWAQRPPCAGGGTCAFVLDVSGFQGDLSVSVGWHMGTLGVEIEERFGCVLQGVLEFILEFGEEEMSVADLLERLD